MAVAAGLVIIRLILVPGIYLFSFAVAALSSFIGKKVHGRLGLTQSEMIPQSIETQEVQC